VKDVTAPLPGEPQQARVDRVTRHLQQAHPEVDLMDPTWLEHPLQAHEAIHRQVPEDLPDPHTLSTEPDTLSVASDTYAERIKERLSEMLGSTLQPIIIDAMALQISLTTRSWLLDQAHATVPDSREHHELRRLAERAIEGLDR